MKIQLTLLLSVVALLTLNLHCEKDDPDALFEKSQQQLPPITTTGANTFGCTINGKNWVAYSDYSFPKLMVDYFNDGTLRVIAYKKKKGKDDDETIDFSISSVLKPDIYLLAYKIDTITNKMSNHMFYSPPLSWSYSYQTDFTHSGRVEILRIDTILRIVSGTFEANLAYYDPNSSDSVIQIRNGRFDVKY